MEEEEKKESEHEQPNKKHNFTEKIRENPWILSTLVCGILVIILLIATFSGGLTGNMSKEKVGENVVDFLNNYIVQGGGITLDSVEENTKLGVYTVTVNSAGKSIPLSLSQDGKYIDLGVGIMNIDAYIKSLSASSSQSSDTDTQTTEVLKSDKPSVELYVFTYCPYGLQMEKAMIPVIKLLGNAIDFKVRQIGAMHGEYEKVEAKRQLCIEKNYKDKFLDYVLAFAEDTSCSTGADACITTKVNALYTKLGIDASKINSCMTSEGDNLYNAEVSNANSKGIGGSPTLVINGVTSQASRSPEAVKGVICEAFNDVPSSCTQTLSTSQASAGFGDEISTTNTHASGSC